MRENQFGKLSEFYLTAAYRDGRTVMEDVSFTAPFKVMHPFYEGCHDGDASDCFRRDYGGRQAGD